MFLSLIVQGDTNGQENTGKVRVFIQWPMKPCKKQDFINMLEVEENGIESYLGEYRSYFVHNILNPKGNTKRC